MQNVFVLIIVLGLWIILLVTHSWLKTKNRLTHEKKQEEFYAQAKEPHVNMITFFWGKLKLHNESFFKTMESLPKESADAMYLEHKDDMFNVFDHALYYNPEIRRQLLERGQYNIDELLTPVRYTPVERIIFGFFLKHGWFREKMFNFLLDSTRSPERFLSEAIMRNPERLDYSSCNFLFSYEYIQ